MCVHLFFFPKAFPKSQLENMAEDRNMIHVALCGRTPEIKDPFIIEPKKEDPNKARWCEKRTWSCKSIINISVRVDFDGFDSQERMRCADSLAGCTSAEG